MIDLLTSVGEFKTTIIYSFAYTASKRIAMSKYILNFYINLLEVHIIRSYSCNNGH